jgi:hypothetical protein
MNIHKRTTRKWYIFRFLIFKMIILALSFGQSNYLTDFNPDSLRFKTATAVRCSEAPVIDGLLDDPVWQSALPIDEFFQIDPLELALPAELTIARVLYDDESLYISFRSYDSQPDRIKRALVRRDNWMEGFNSNSDWVGFSIDSRNDDYNGYFFAVNASGVKIDVSISGHENYDQSWDAVWDVAVAFDEDGWTAEFDLPFAMFQFDNIPDLVWGVEFLRGIHRVQESLMWPGRAKSVRGTVFPLGVLLGLENIPDPKQLEIIPYTLLGRSAETRLDYGLDVRYGLTSNSIMKMTFNPDFGQVEADPSVLNLTAFETFYDEKRPFFSEGAEFFDQSLSLFHSRRIGRVPSYNLPEEGEIRDAPDYTTILGATKVMGNTASGINYGLISAITAEESAILVIDSVDQSDRRIVIEPRTNFTIGRIEVPLINDVSRVGLMVTNVSRKNNFGATVAGIDWNLGLYDNRLYTNGQIVRSDAKNITGNAIRFRLGYVDPSWWSARLWYGYFDDKFDVNDLGYLQRNNTNWAGGKVDFRKQEPWGKFINNDLEFKYMQEWRGDGLVLERELEIEQSNLFNNYYTAGFFSKVFLPAYNDEDIFRNEEAWAYKTELWGYAGPTFSTDRRKKLVLNAVIGSGYGKNRGWGYHASLGAEIKPIEPLNIEIKAIQDRGPTYMQWVDVVETQNDTVRVYANSLLLTRDVTLRLNWTFSPDLSLQCFVQPFYANMKYESFYRLLEPETMDLEGYNYLNDDNDNPDFKLQNTIGTFVLRWEYRSGSTLFIVYNLNDNKFYSPVDKAWISEEANALYFKLNYWIKN